MINPRLEQVFNLAPVSAQPVAETSSANADLVTDHSNVAATAPEQDLIDAALPLVRDLECTEQELDQLAHTAQQGYENLMELGMSVDTRHAADIFSAAGTLLGHALSAKRNKIERKLKTVDLQLRKRQLDLKTKALQHAPDTVQAQVQVLDRNQLLAQLRNQQQCESNPADSAADLLNSQKE